MFNRRVMTSNRTLSTNMEIGGISICRLCAEMSSYKSLTSLYTKDAQEQTVTKQINQLVENLISPNDGLPQVVCTKCVDKVAQCYTFINNVIESQNKLRRTLHLPEIGTLSTASGNDKENINNGWEKEADYGSRASTSSIKPGTFDVNDKVDLWLEDSVGQNLEANGAKSTFRATRPTIEERLKRDSLRLFRCGVCHETFKDRHECLCHIIDKHPEAKKPITSDTIFESVCRQASKEKKRFLTDHQLEELQTKRVAVKSPSSSTEDQPQKKNARQRKVLAIDGFYREVHKRVTRYVCDMCGRVMISEFTFRRHLREHEYSDGEEEMLKEEAAAKEKAKPIEPRPCKGYCKQCRKSVPHSSRHKMYHEICVLERDYPDVTEILNKA